MAELDVALHDWAERISVEACARVRENGGPEMTGFAQEHWDIFSAAAFTGAALALQSIVAIDGLDSEMLRRLVKETP